MAVFVFATLDTKGIEADFVCEQLRAAGLSATLVDVGSLGEPQASPRISREQVFLAAGASLDEIRQQADRGAAIAAAARGAAAIAARAYEQGELEGVLAIGGSAGTTIGTSAMRALPLGVPKVMVSTLASGSVRAWVQDKDIAMFNSVVDIAGLNRISRRVLTNAAQATVGMVTHLQRVANAMPADEPEAVDRPLVAATMFGVTTPAVEHARRILESSGYEVLVFHATGGGGQAMESLIAEGLIAGVLDLTTTELADELVGGILTAGPHRLTAAGLRGTPQVVSVGALDMVNFGPPESVPAKFAKRKFYRHNPTVTLMRTTAAENTQLGAILGQKLSAAQGPAAVMLPSAGVSAIDREGQIFDDPAARAALYNAIRHNLRGPELIELEAHINDEAFAAAAAQKLIELMR